MTNTDRIKTFMGGIELYYMAAKRAFMSTTITANKELFIGYCMDIVTKYWDSLGQLVGEEAASEVVMFIMRLVDLRLEFYLPLEQKEQ